MQTAGKRRKDDPGDFDFDARERAFARLVRERRELVGMTQAELAERLADLTKGKIRLDPTAITRIEGGKRPIRLGEAYALAVVLELKPEDVLRGGEREWLQQVEIRWLEDEIAEAELDIDARQEWVAEIRDKIARMKNGEEVWAITHKFGYRTAWGLAERLGLRRGDQE